MRSTSPPRRRRAQLTSSPAARAPEATASASVPKTKARRVQRAWPRLTIASSSDPDRGIQHVAPGEGRLGQHVAAPRLAHVVTAERSIDGEALDIERVYREHVAMRPRVVPRRARAVIAVIVAGHVLVAREPLGVVVEAVARAVRRLGAGLAARHDAR